MKKEENFLNIARLIANEMNESNSDEEREYLEQWLNESVENKNIYEEIKGDDWYLTNLESIQEYNVEEGWNNIKPRIQSISKLKKLIPQFFKYAAVAIMLLGIGYFYQQGYFTNDSEINTPSEHITLQLENGNIEIINEDGSSKIVDAQGDVVGSQNGTQLVYSNEVDKETLVYNTLTVPYGKRFEVKLSDGTVVNLNAGTSLKYPIKFIKGENRKVFLNGEAYFNVTKDASHPFIVRANEIDVRVLGTQFNITSYPEDEHINTVLIEGAVSIYENEINYKPNAETYLEPGFKATWNKKEDHIDVDEVETEIYTAWISGKIILKHVLFKNIIKKLERHYNVIIINNNVVLDNVPFTTSFDIETIEEAFEIFNEIYQIDYTIENSKIIIN